MIVVDASVVVRWFVERPIYLAHAESLGTVWLTADMRAIRTLGVRPLGPPP